eukprot:6195173-Pyramimonas_sp.AAC.1
MAAGTASPRSAALMCGKFQASQTFSTKLLWCFLELFDIVACVHRRSQAIAPCRPKRPFARSAWPRPSMHTNSFRQALSGRH